MNEKKILEINNNLNFMYMCEANEKYKIKEKVDKYKYLSDKSHAIAAKCLLWDSQTWIDFIPFLNDKRYILTLNLYKEILKEMLKHNHFKLNEVDNLILYAWSNSLLLQQLPLNMRISSEEERYHFISSPVDSIDENFCVYCWYKYPCFYCGKMVETSCCKANIGLHFCARDGADIINQDTTFFGSHDRYRLLDGRLIPNIQNFKNMNKFNYEIIKSIFTAEERLENNIEYDIDVNKLMKEEEIEEDEEEKGKHNFLVNDS